MVGTKPEEPIGMVEHPPPTARDRCVLPHGVRESNGLDGGSVTRNPTVRSTRQK